MANRTDTQADTVHGTNPQYLVDRIIRVKIYNDAYWKEFCFGLTTESFIDRAAEIDYVGGTYGGRRRPAKFLCLFLKMLQIQPDDDVVMEYIKQADLKYLRALGAAYLRISARPKTVYQTLEPLYADYRKLRYRDIAGKLSIIHMDEFVDWLLREETVCDVTMPQLPKREILEQSIQLPPRKSILEDDLADLEDLEEAVDSKEQTSEGAGRKAADKSPSPKQACSPRPPKRSASPRRRSSSRGGRARARSSSRSPKRRGRSASGSPDRGRSRSCSAQSRLARKDKKEKKKQKKDKKDKKDGREKSKRNAAEEEKGSKKKDGLSAEQWDEVRKELGLKPLKR